MEAKGLVGALARRRGAAAGPVRQREMGQAPAKFAGCLVVSGAGGVQQQHVIFTRK